MNCKKLYKLAPIAAALGLGAGLSGNAQADAYAYSFNDIFDVTTNFVCSTTGSGCAIGSEVSEFAFVSYQSSSSSDANITNGTSGVSGSQVTNGVVTNGIITGFTPQINPDAPVSYEGAGSAQSNNDWSQIGMVDDNYASGDAQIVSQQVGQLNTDGAPDYNPLPDGPGSTQAISEAEGFITNDNLSIANGANSSSTGIAIAFTLSDSFFVEFDFLADPFIESFISAGGSSTGDLDVSFTLRDINNVILFNWQPNGQIDSIGGTVGGVETLDEATLNVEIADITTDGTSEFYDPVGDGDCVSEGGTACGYSAYSNEIGAGTYTLILTMHNGIILGQSPVVPVPGTLALMGLGLLGLGGLSRKNRKKA